LVLSKEAIITFLGGVIVAALLVLLDPKQPLFRGSLWAIVATSCVLVVAYLGCLRITTYVDLLGSPEREQISHVRLAITITLVAWLTLIVAIRTWPPQEFSKGPVPVSMQPPLPPNYVLIYPTTLNPASPKRIPSPKEKVVPPANGSKGQDKTLQEGEKPKPISANYPIIEVASAQITYSTDIKKLSVVIVIANSTSTNANAHISMESYFLYNGQETPNPGSQVVRDIGLGPPPFTYELKQDTTLSEGAAKLYEDGTLSIMFYLSVMYPDRGKTNTYHYKGQANKSLDHLDYLESHWDF
jgi:hypothetical protein